MKRLFPHIVNLLKNQDCRVTLHTLSKKDGREVKRQFYAFLKEKKEELKITITVNEENIIFEKRSKTHEEQRQLDTRKPAHYSPGVKVS